MSRISIAATALILCSLACVPLPAGAASPLPDGMKILGGFTAQDGAIQTKTSIREARLTTTKPLQPGVYVLTAEVRTTGFGPLGRFAMDAKTPDYKTGLSGYEWVGAASDWTPTTIYLHLASASNVVIRAGNWQHAKSGATVALRNISIQPFDFAKAARTNWLVNGSLDGGRAGELPPDWYSKSKSPKVEQESLADNASFRSGKHVLRMTGDGENARMLQSHSLPMPPNGEVTLSVWARSTDGGDMALHVVRAGWGSRVEKHFKPTEQWKRYSATWSVNAGDKDSFFLRIDKDKGTSTIEIADIQLTWKPSGATADVPVAVDPYEDAKTLGWPGAPGPNLLLNPDFEVGATGFFYDFSWPKTYGHYASIRKAKPIDFVQGAGVDGGTAARLRNNTLRAYCFPVTVGKTYTISMDLRATDGKTSAKAQVLSFDSEWQAALWSGANDIPADAWKRYSWTIKWTKPNIQKRGYVRVSGDGVLVDRIQVVEGTEKDYQAPPVMLGMDYDRLPYFVRGRDAAKATIVIVPGVKKTGTADVVVTARDAWGRTSWERKLTAPLDKTTRVPVDLPTEAMGTFHVDLRATTDGKTAGIGIGRYAIIAPPVRAVGSHGYALGGICQETFNFPVWLCEDHATIQTDLGIGLNRFFASIPPDLPMPIPAEFSQDLLAKAKPFNDAKIALLPCVELIPESVAKANADLDMPTQEDLDAFGKWVRAYVTPLARGIRHYEIFNEPNLWRVGSGPNKGKRTMFPRKYLEFQKVAYTTIKDIDPELQVVCNALNNVQWDYIDEWMKLGAGKYMDAFSFHPYGVTNFLETGLRLEEVMKGFEFAGPSINSEKYYGANLFYDRAGYEETRRGYYLPHFGELATAGRSIQHFLTHAAVDAPVCFFNPTGTLSRRGPGGELFVYDFFGAYSAAIHMVANAGRGEKIELGPSVEAIVFPAAPDGPLVATWTSRPDVAARMKLAAGPKVFDIMGNLYSADERKLGVRIARDPAYIRFDKGTTVDAIAKVLQATEIVGLGEPFGVDLAITGGDRVSAYVRSLRNRPMDGAVRLVKLPDGWKASKTTMPFEDLQPGQTVRVDFPFETIDIQPMGSYPVSAVAEHTDEFARTDAVLRPIFAKRIEKITADGNLSDWADAMWIDLGDEHVSKAFSQTLNRAGDADLSARMALAWNEDALAIALVVTDNNHTPGEAPALGWQGDSVQLYFDPRNDATAEKPNRADDVEYIISRIGQTHHAWINKGAQGNYKGKANKAENLEDGDVQLSITRVDGKTIYEIVLPRAACLPGATLAKDKSLGFSLLINDNDGQGRKTGLTLAPKGSEPYGHPDEYMDLILRP